MLSRGVMKYACTSSRLLKLLLCVQTVLLLIVAWNTGPGWDEWGHLPSGLFTLEYGNHDPYCVNPPLTRLWCALPVWLVGGGIGYESLPQMAGFRAEGLLALTYIEQHREQVFTWMSVARTAAIPIAWLGTYLIWRIGKRLFSTRVALCAAALWVFSPTVLTFGASVTPDVSAAVFGLLAAWRFYIWLRLGRLNDAAWLGLCVGLAMLTKASWLILPPLMAVVSMLYALRYRRHWKWTQRLRQAALVVGICWVSIHAMYEFRGILQPLGSFEFVSETLGGERHENTGLKSPTGNRFRGTWFAYVPAPLPAAYLRGIDIQKRDFESGMTSYFLGQWRDHGWWYYYLVGIWLKEPLALWILTACGLFLWVKGGFRLGTRTQAISRMIVFAPGVALFVFVSSQTGFNHHLRYVLPFLPCFYLLVAAGAALWPARARLLVPLLVIGYAVSSVSILPRSYAYFSEAVGGPEQGWKYLGDSNLDWGQDLPTAKQWIQAIPDKRPVYLVYSLPFIDFHKVGMDAEDGKPSVTLAGPILEGWWIVFALPKIHEENQWFRDHDATERLSVTTSVFEISADEAEENRLSVKKSETAP